MQIWIIKLRSSKNTKLRKGITKLHENYKVAQNDNTPERMIIDCHETFDQEKMANYFNNFSEDSRSKLALMIPGSQTKFDKYFNPY